MIDAPTPRKRPLSVRIGRIVVRSILLGLVVWGGLYAYRTWQAKKRAEEIAPIHRFAEGFYAAMKGGDYFSAQEMLAPADQHVLSIDWLAHVAKQTEINASTALTWGDWNRTDGAFRAYHLKGAVRYRTGRTLPLEASVEHNGTVTVLKKWKIGEHTLHPKIPPEL